MRDITGTRSTEIVKTIFAQKFPKYGLGVQIIEYRSLRGNTNINNAQRIHFMGETNLRCRQVALTIEESAVKIEAGGLSYCTGNLDVTTGIDSVSKALSQFFTSKLTGERFAMPVYRGSGEIVLEPSFKHFLVKSLEAGEAIVCDKGMFVAASESVKVSPVSAGTVTGTTLGGEGFFQQLIEGPGIAVLESPVPEEEIDVIEIHNDVLRVDGNFALFRDAQIAMSVERSSRTLVGSAVGGEGLLNTYRGTGRVFLAPTLKVYDAIALASQLGGDLSKVDFNTSTGRALPKQR